MSKELSADEQVCPSCNGNDRDKPCLHPSEGVVSCLRDIRLDAHKPQGEPCVWECRRGISVAYVYDDVSAKRAENEKSNWGTWKVRPLYPADSPPHGPHLEAAERLISKLHKIIGETDCLKQLKALAEVTEYNKTWKGE